MTTPEVRPTTYSQGNKVEYTGKVEELYGGTFYQVRVLEGSEKGKLRDIVKPPPSVDKVPEAGKAMLRDCKDPRRKGIKLTSLGNGFLTKGNRWFVEEFSGSDGECYERAKRQWGYPIVKWFIIVLD